MQAAHLYVNARTQLTAACEHAQKNRISVKMDAAMRFEDASPRRQLDAP